jgi:hypothetical protein
MPPDLPTEPLAEPRVEPRVEAWIDRIVSSPTVRSGYASLLAHVIVCILLALFAIRSQGPDRRPQPLVLHFGAEAEHDSGAGKDPAPQVDIARLVENEPAADAADAAAAEVPPQEAAAPAADVLDEEVPLVAVAVPDAAAGDVPQPFGADAIVGPQAQPVSVRIAPARDRFGKPATSKNPSDGSGFGSTNQKPFAARRGDARRRAATSRGGSAASEAAVERGLAWLATHQAVDGSWQFDLTGCRCDGACRDPGTLDSSTASTAIALLPFLGAGNTHADGPHQQTVSRGIYYLISRMQPTPRGGDFCEGTMYGHGVTTLALAEALGMTKDEMLVPYVRDAVRFIETAQDMHGGGWRYLPGQAGDTTVTAWQLAALKSASMSGLEVPSPTIDGVRRFLDRVQTQKGAGYGYRTPASKPCTSAIGLLCRMYTGWGPEQEALNRGLTNLAKPGPSPSAVYQNFYLSQALLQLDHPVWPRWNLKNREQLLAQQARFGHEAGSWFFADPDTATGGRLAHTALAVLTLEVYYRLLPIYKQEAVADGF